MEKSLGWVKGFARFNGALKNENEEKPFKFYLINFTSFSRQSLKIIFKDFFV